MYVVIFRAITKQLDEEYSKTAQEMRKLALEQYGCIEFTSLSEGEQEIALSYWHSEEDIQKWKGDARHFIAQKNGQEKWYQSYSVEIAEISRSYHYPAKK